MTFSLSEEGEEDDAECKDEEPALYSAFSPTRELFERRRVTVMLFTVRYTLTRFVVKVKLNKME